MKHNSTHGVAPVEAQSMPAPDLVVDQETGTAWDAASNPELIGAPGYAVYYSEKTVRNTLGVHGKDDKTGEPQA